MAQRAEDRIGTTVEVLIETQELDEDGEPTGRLVGRAGHQGPDDGSTIVIGAASIGDFVTANVVDTEGVDLLAEPV
jgi:tRNA A37 methylthiotransferase MiaB